MYEMLKTIFLDVLGLAKPQGGFMPGPAEEEVIVENDDPSIPRGPAVTFGWVGNLPMMDLGGHPQGSSEYAGVPILPTDHHF